MKKLFQNFIFTLICHCSFSQDSICASLWLNACLPWPPAVVREPCLTWSQCQAVHNLVSVRSGSARPSPTLVLILGLSEDPALNSSCNTGKRSNWGIFRIINSDEQPSHSPSRLPLQSLPPSLTPRLFPDLSIFFILWVFSLFSYPDFFGCFRVEEASRQ